jgi:hypothetical protein
MENTFKYNPKFVPPIVDGLNDLLTKFRNSWGRIIVFCIITTLFIISLIFNYGFSLGSNGYNSNRLVICGSREIFSTNDASGIIKIIIGIILSFPLVFFFFSRYKLSCCHYYIFHILVLFSFTLFVGYIYVYLFSSPYLVINKWEGYGLVCPISIIVSKDNNYGSYFLKNIFLIYSHNKVDNLTISGLCSEQYTPINIDNIQNFCPTNFMILEKFDFFDYNSSFKLCLVSKNMSLSLFDECYSEYCNFYPSAFFLLAFIILIGVYVFLIVLVIPIGNDYHKYNLLHKIYVEEIEEGMISDYELYSTCRCCPHMTDIFICTR